MSACYRLQLNNQRVYTNCGHTLIQDQLNYQILLAWYRCDKTSTHFVFDWNCIVEIPHKENWHRKDVLFADEIVCYTDGYRIQRTGLAGASVFYATDNEEINFQLCKYTTVFQAEVYTLLRCAKLESLLQRDNASVTVCSNSQAALKTVSTPKINSALLDDFWSVTFNIWRFEWYGCQVTVALMINLHR